jgi:hypothetical protein
VLTIPAATRLLAQARDVSGLLAIARTCGFDGEPAELDGAARSALGLHATVRATRVVEGPGILRALCAEVRDGALTRDAVAQMAIRLQQRSPFTLWLVLFCERKSIAAIATAVIAPRRHASVLVVDRSRIVDSDAETLRSLAGAHEGPDLLVHGRWCELLGREAVTRRFFRALERTVGILEASVASHVPAADARGLAILTSTRLLFLAFLEAKGWLDGDHGFLRRTWDACMAGRGSYHRNVLLPLCFGTLNTPRSRRAAAARAFGKIPFLNGGLFTRSALERRHTSAVFPDDALGALVGDLLGRWRFTAREHESTHAEAAVDPEMLGLAFESLMASHERRSSGSFYTPRVLVERVFEAALGASFESAGLADSFAALRAGAALPADVRGRVRERLSSLRILDPACGSGAFLVHALDTVARLRAQCDDPLPSGALRREILARQLFGVDREPTAVWLCELRLWLAVVVESDETDPLAVPPLPNLDAQVRVGDALAGDAFLASGQARTAQLTRLRVRYARTTGARKRMLARALIVEERRAAVAAIAAPHASAAQRRRDLLAVIRGHDLFGMRPPPGVAMRAHLDELRHNARELRAERRSLLRGGAVAFDFAAQFADVGARGGFDVIIGNPPWVRLHRIPPMERLRMRARFTTYRAAGWRAGAILAGAAPGFAAQVDLSALFVERAVTLARTGGAIALLVPAKLWRSLAGGGVRHFLLQSSRIVELEDWSEARATFDAAVYPSLVVAVREPPDPRADVRVAEHRRDQVLGWTTPVLKLGIDESPGAPWPWLPGAARDGFDRMRARGMALGERQELRPRLGVKCGCNEAFLLTRCDDGSFAARDGRRGRIEPALVRPLLRGESVSKWRLEPAKDAIVFPYDDALNLVQDLPPAARAWLQPFRARLRSRSDFGGRKEWWTLFRTEAADSRRPRVVWADLSRSPRAAVIPAGDRTVPLNTCYVVFADSMAEAYALATWLNSPLASAWLAALAEPARGGFRRMFGWTMSLVPIPKDWESAITLLAPIGERAARGEIPPADEHLDASLRAIGMSRREVASLLTWGHR